MPEKKSNETKSTTLTVESKPAPSKKSKPKVCKVKPGKTVVCVAGKLKGGEVVPSRLQADFLKSGVAEWV